MPIYLLFDVGSTYTKGMIVDTQSETILAIANDKTTSSTDISIGIDKVKLKMKDILDKVTIDQTLMCSSAKGGLKMIAVGLVPDLTLKAATLACYSAGAKVIHSYAYQLNQSELNQINCAQADILLLSGGTDGGNTEVVLYNAKQIASLHPSFPIIYAGNKVVQDEIKAIFLKENVEVLCCENVMPTYGILQVDECRKLIRDLFLKTIVKAKGLTQVSAVIDDIILPTPSSVLEALILLSKGTKHVEGLGDLMAIDIGGATTDVYSINKSFILKDNVGYKGLQEPLDKRSVEGDLGVRFSAPHVADLMKNEIEFNESMSAYLESIQNDLHCINDPTMDSILASWCTRIASERHAGKIEVSYSPIGISTYQTGKDLRDMTKVIGIGGPLIHSKDPQHILENVIRNPKTPEILLPDQIETYLDQNYVISCLGLLASRHPDEVVRMLKRNVEKIK
jgi:uncharacterized protein (TIGR01319 family)